MRTTISLDEELIKQAQHYTSIKETAALVGEALTRLVRNEAAKRLRPWVEAIQRRKLHRGEEWKSDPSSTLRSGLIICGSAK